MARKSVASTTPTEEENEVKNPRATEGEKNRRFNKVNVSYYSNAIVLRQTSDIFAQFECVLLHDLIASFAPLPTYPVLLWFQGT